MAIVSILSNKRKIFPKTEWEHCLFKGSGMVQGKLLFMKYYPQVWRFLKNNLNSNRHGYTFDNVPISFRENFSLV